MRLLYSTDDPTKIGGGGPVLHVDPVNHSALVTQSGVTFTDRSGTITLGATAQDVAVANTNRQYLMFQNHSDTDMWINEVITAVAAQPSIKIAAGTTYEPRVAPKGKISVLCATTGKAFTCKEA
jgi:hypothetical protein